MFHIFIFVKCLLLRFWLKYGVGVRRDRGRAQLVSICGLAASSPTENILGVILIPR